MHASPIHLLLLKAADRGESQRSIQGDLIDSSHILAPAFQSRYGLASVVPLNKHSQELPAFLVTDRDLRLAARDVLLSVERFRSECKQGVRPQRCRVPV